MGGDNNLFNGTSDEKLETVHPRETANCLSRLFFCWPLPLFWKGFKGDLCDEVLFNPLKEHESNHLGDKLEQEWKLDKTLNETASLWRILWKIFGKRIIAYGFIIFFLEFIIKLAQPLALWRLMLYFSPHVHVAEIEAHISIVVIVVASFANVVCYHSCTFGLQHLGMKMKVACCSLIYRKSLRLRKTADTKTGTVMNLLSNDVNRFDTFLTQIHYLWVAPLNTFVIMFLLYTILSPLALAGFGMFFLFIPLQMYLGKVWSTYRSKTANKTDERARLLNEVISGIQVVKMYTWEKIFVKLINKVRREEIGHIQVVYYLKAFHSSFNKYVTRTATFICILSYVLTGHNLGAQYVYVVKSFYNLLKDCVTLKFPLAIGYLAETMISVARIEEFLASEEVSVSNNESRQDCGIVLEKICAKCTGEDLDVLSNISITINPCSLVAVVGPIGAGKTSLLNVILNELAVTEGRRVVKGRISYAPQQPWLFAGTIRENILFGENFDQNRYKEVIEVCALNHDFDILPFADNSIVGDRGVTLSGGQKARINLARAVYRNADIYLLDDPFAAVDASVGLQLFEECILRYLADKCVVLVTHQLQYLKRINTIYSMDKGTVETFGNCQEIWDSSERLHSALKDEQVRKKVSECEELSDDEEEKTFNSTDDQPSILEEKINYGKISWSVYRKYLTSGGACCFLIVIAFFVFSQVAASGMDYYESFWVNLVENGGNYNSSSWYRDFFTTTNCIYIYSGLILVTITITVFRSIFFFVYFLRVSVELHNKMFSAVINTTMDFFHSTPSGRILNRFCNDIGAIDEILPPVLMDTIQIGLNVLAITFIITIVNHWIVIVNISMLLTFYLFRRFYLATGRHIKRLTATTRSPVFSHLNSSLNGLETIRAFGAEQNLQNQFDRLQNVHASTFYMFLACTTTFGFWLDMFCALYIGLVTTSFYWSNYTQGGSVGLLITQAMSLTGMFQWGMKQWTELENHMVSVERVLDYTKSKREEIENPLEFVPDESWPENYQINFNSVSMTYNNEESLALNQLDFVIKPKEKVGVIGRTGAGKSSIISALFRLVKFDGSILIGGVDINELPLEKVRSKISIIPQEPILFSGTIRQNLDPYRQFDDWKLWQVLEELGLKDFVSSTSEGLEMTLFEGASNLSVGQRQLLCLARALLRENRIVVLDEATANLDLATDEVIRTTIAKKFADCTVIIIAHRLHTIMDCDKVLVMDCGRIVEYDHPFTLMQNHNGALREFVRKCGTFATNSLMETAEKNFYKRTSPSSTSST